MAMESKRRAQQKRLSSTNNILTGLKQFPDEASILIVATNAQNEVQGIFIMFQYIFQKMVIDV